VVLDAHRARVDFLLDPFVRAFAAAGLTPNALTLLSFAAAVGAGALFATATLATASLLLAAAALVFVNALLDACDGKLARRTGAANPRGDYLDHAIDRYADVALFFGLALGPWIEWWWGFAAMAGVLLTSYMGTQAQAVGVGRNYAGLLGRADRLFLLMALPVAQWALSGTAFATVADRSVLGWGIVAIAILSNATALQRFAQGWRELGRRR